MKELLVDKKFETTCGSYVHVHQRRGSPFLVELNFFDGEKTEKEATELTSALLKAIAFMRGRP